MEAGPFFMSTKKPQKVVQKGVSISAKATVPAAADENGYQYMDESQMAAGSTDSMLMGEGLYVAMFYADVCVVVVFC
jgi:hypothetical protein